MSNATTRVVIQEKSGNANSDFTSIVPLVSLRADNIPPTEASIVGENTPFHSIKGIRDTIHCRSRALVVSFGRPPPKDTIC